QTSDVLVLPLRGIFAKHDGPGHRFVAASNHAVLIPADRPYRLSFPGAVGDHCLTLRFSTAALERAIPVELARGQRAAFAPIVLLAPIDTVARSVIWHRLERGESDPLELETLAAAVLSSVLQTADLRGRRPHVRAPSASGRRKVNRVKEAIALQPERKWSL